ncbi:sorting nexin mvp-1 [Verticillium alfalfae VaMs.102]|uniref:Sorting nexin MVP1 n=1 Tax=Verticillium alfalfae (strain VaMs.102 / ATCC MYA-4576 / FGSC 10136) TaxID=526221 RepID=C9SSD6_VERA1|nr:sorting nexin mvp-1 [Verticillium alfalfae VaMs.102]EEY21701.1 sorting nexin mvp-1 [Verticillium alfalfae VaMs.102]
MPTPRKQKTRADLLRTLLPTSDAPDSYIDTFDTVVQEDGSNGRVNASGVAKVFAAARLGADEQASIMAIIAPNGNDVAVGRNEFNVFLALIEVSFRFHPPFFDSTASPAARSLSHVSAAAMSIGSLALISSIGNLGGGAQLIAINNLDLPKPKLAGVTAEPVMPPVSELAAKPPQAPETPVKEPTPAPSPAKPKNIAQAPMQYPDADDPWGSPDLHKNHNHAPAPRPAQTNGAASANHDSNGQTGFGTIPSTAIAGRTMSSYTTATVNSNIASPQQPTSTGVGASPAGGGWGGGFFDGSNVGGGFAEPQPNPVLPSPFGAAAEPNRHLAAAEATITPSLRPLPSNRTGGAVEENIVVSLMPEKEGLFFFQHHNYEVSSSRRGSKVVRRYSDFVWLLDCLHKRYPFRVLPLLPPKRVAVNGNHLSNDGAFIEKRRRGLARFLNAVVRHPILGQEQLVIMFLTVPTELTVWRKQATISVQDEFVGRTLPPGLEDSLPATLEELFDRSRTGVRRSAELYINVCNIMDRLVKRSDGVAADHARIALSLQSLTELSNDTYATDTNDVPLLNDGLTAMGKHLKTCQSLMEDESKAWDQGVLEDLKRQRDSLVAIREMFERRDRLDKDNIPYLERRIQTNESKLANLRGKPDGLVKPGEIEKVVEAIIKDKESIVNQHNRSIFVKECIRDELIYFQSTQYHVSRWNQDWAQERVKYSEMLADNWRRLLDELDGMPLGD